ncbi:uncharacterized protein DFL_000515 [Arthrobotrys flagrans]|uniref:Uncharacterized protein n=1 Tax=Arthrobotrys flagrans TaxID=97331 RepID=A0A437AEG7_ARTFL|nr:hypothetical protein DFL_000515 [Arthrobotrys flagrans]
MAPSRTKTLNYTVEVVDKAGKAIHTSKTIFGALREAREAYKAKRAERKAEREAEKAARRAIKERAYEEQLREARRARREARRAIEDDSRTEERRRERRERRERRMIEDGRSDAGTEVRDRDAGSDTSSIYSHRERNGSTGALTLRSASTTDLSLPPMPPRPEVDEEDDHLTALFTQVQDIIDHAAAAQSSVVTLVDALRREPETLAMVGLTLAEISTIVAKLSPAALAGAQISWPVVFSFLASPQFAIVAGGVIGTTVILLGGYRIIQKMIYGEPAKPPEIVDMGGTVVDEGDVRAITAAGEPPAPTPAVMEITQRIEEIKVNDTARERERERHHRSRKDAEDDPLAFGHSEPRRRHTHRDEGSRRSHDDSRRPSMSSRSHTVPVDARSNELAINTKVQQPDVPPLAFDISPKKEKRSSSRSRPSRSKSEYKPRSPKSDDSKRSYDKSSEKSSGKRERDTKDAEGGGKYFIVRRRK